MKVILATTVLSICSFISVFNCRYLDKEASEFLRTETKLATESRKWFKTIAIEFCIKRSFGFLFRQRNLDYLLQHKRNYRYFFLFYAIINNLVYARVFFWLKECQCACKIKHVFKLQVTKVSRSFIIFALSAVHKSLPESL